MAPDTSDVKIVKVDAPTPNMAGPAEPVPTVIGMAKDNPLIAEGEPMLDLSNTLSVQAVKDEPTPEPPVSSTVVEPIRPLGPPRARRSSMKGGRAAEAEAPAVAAAAAVAAAPESDVKVIKIDA